VRDNRSRASRLWSTFASLLLNATVLTGVIVTSQVAAVRSSSQRVLAELHRHRGEYRMILLVSPGRMPGPAAPPSTPPPRRAARPAPKPLAVPDPRLLERMDPRVVRFVRDNPAVESVITRELVRDLNSRALDPQRILAKSSIRVGFEVGEDGAVLRPRIEKSSMVPSIDHLALELAKLVEAYQLLAAVKGVTRVVLAIDVGDEIEVRVLGFVRNPQETEQVRKQVQNLLALSRFALAKTEGAFMLQEISIESADGQISLRRSFPKAPLIEFLARYYAEPQK
jgi:hypothetical protein